MAACTICTLQYTRYQRRPVVLPCGHTFCQLCIDRLKQGCEVRCPTCRQQTNITSAHVNVALHESAPFAELTDGVVTLAPYFKLNDSTRFKQIWQEDYKRFAHKEDCVHYAFCFTSDGRAHCREAYPNAEKVLQHLADVDVPLKAVLAGPAELERLEVHGPKEEIEKLREPLGPLGCLFYVSEWGFRTAKPSMDWDTVCHLYPYFQLKDPSEFRKTWYGAYAMTQATAEAEKSHQYSFSFEPTTGVASCRESYADADGILLHLKNVDAPLKSALRASADLLRLEVHAPAREIEQLRPALAPLGCQFFVTEWGFRNSTNSSTLPQIPQSPLKCAPDTTLSIMTYWEAHDAHSFLRSCQRIKELVKRAPGVRYYGFSMSANLAVVREGHASLESYKLHLRNVQDHWFEAMSAATVTNMEAHGPKEQVEDLEDALKDMLSSYWAYADGAFIVPTKYLERADQGRLLADDTLSVMVYWSIRDYAKFLAGVKDFQRLTKQEDKVKYYGFCLFGAKAICREGYDCANGFLEHLMNVDAPLQAAMLVADVTRVEVHGPVAEVEKLREPLRDFPAVFWSYPDDCFFAPAEYSAVPQLC